MRHGRASVTRWWGPLDPQTGAEEKDVRQGGSVSAEWAVAMPLSTGAYYEFAPSGDDTHTIHWGINRVWSVWLHINPAWVPVEKRTGRAKARWERKDFADKQIGVTLHDWTFHWHVWKDPHSWSRADGWRNSHFNVKDWVLGRTVHDEEVLEEVTTVVALPEGRYPAHVRLLRETWKRKRGWFGLGEQEVRRADIKVLAADGSTNSIGVPGKGENSWDCDEDGIWEMRTPATTVAEAIGALVESVLGTRERHGGSVTWMPTAPRVLP